MGNDILQIIDRVQFIDSIISTIVMSAINILGIIGAIRTLSLEKDDNIVVKAFCIVIIIACFLCGLTLFKIQAYNDFIVSSGFWVFLFFIFIVPVIPFVYLALRYYKKYKFDKVLTIAMFIWIANLIWVYLLRDVVRDVVFRMLFLIEN